MMWYIDATVQKTLNKIFDRLSILEADVEKLKSINQSHLKSFPFTEEGLRDLAVWAATEAASCDPSDVHELARNKVASMSYSEMFDFLVKHQVSIYMKNYDLYLKDLGRVDGIESSS